MKLSDRFAQLWDEWDGRLREGEDVVSFLEAAKDEELIELLAGESVRERKYERDIVATEILNRLHRRHTDFPAGAEAVLHNAQAAQRSAEAGQAAIHASEALLHAAGEHELGQSISESAYESLDATKLALGAAQQHAADVQSSLSQSRLGDKASAPRQEDLDRTAQAAARAARRGSDLTDDLEAHMGAIGKGPEGKAAAKAGQAIREAADAAAEAAREAGGVTREGP
jgi:hypothetical protein